MSKTHSSPQAGRPVRVRNTKNKLLWKGNNEFQWANAELDRWTDG